MTDVKVYGTIFQVDENAGLSAMERAEPLFFKTKFGKRETYDVYRGCLIVRYTQTFSNNQTQRVPVPYLFGFDTENKCHSTFCMTTDCPNTKAAERLIDEVLAKGVLRE